LYYFVGEPFTRDKKQAELIINDVTYVFFGKNFLFVCFKVILHQFWAQALVSVKKKCVPISYIKTRYLTYMKDGKVLAHLGFKSKVLPGL